MERRFVSCFENGIQGQISGLTDLLRAATLQDATEVQLRLAIEQCMQAYEDYRERRKTLAREDGATFICPRWCTTFEKSVLWIGGCRPTLMIRLLYTLCGIEIQAQLEEFLQGKQSPDNGGLMNLSAQQLQQVNKLHQRTLYAEDLLTSKQASLQEEVSDRPLFPIVRTRQQPSTKSASTSANVPSSAPSSYSSWIKDVEGCIDFVAGQINEDVAAAMKTYADSMAKLMEEADSLRLETTKTLVMEILNAKQAVELLIAAKQLHLSLHDWGLQRDRQLGRRD